MSTRAGLLNGFGIVNIADLPPMEVLETSDSEAVLAARMAKFKERWTFYDPPLGAVYDVEETEFDPMKIGQEVGTFFQTALEARINKAARDTTLAFGSGGNLDGLATRFPGGVPRQPNEPDERYRYRVWLSSNAYSTAGAELAYVFWALTAEPGLRDATASVVRTEDGPGVVVTCMAEGPNPVPTDTQLLTVRTQLNKPGIKPMTVPVQVAGPRIVRSAFTAGLWLQPGYGQETTVLAAEAAVQAYLEANRYLGADHTLLGFQGALARPGVHSADIISPAADLTADPRTLVIPLAPTRPDGRRLFYLGRKS